jgi:hypothetical protein
MKSPTASAILAVAALSSCTLAIVTLPIARNRDAGPISKFRRRDTITEILGNNETGGLYTAQALVGTPPHNQLPSRSILEVVMFGCYLQLQISAQIPCFKDKDVGVDVELLVSRCAS